jgi:hypothetical protein
MNKYLPNIMTDLSLSLFNSSTCPSNTNHPLKRSTLQNTGAMMVKKQNWKSSSKAWRLGCPGFNKGWPYFDSNKKPGWMSSWKDNQLQE